ncbi:MAG: bestrophin family ion channel [Bryobacter sp.]|nr:bestrophin family ion channel [Bryobacter sp.]
MIQYDPHKWLDHFFDVRGSLVKEISGRLLAAVVWSVAVVWVDGRWMDLGISSLIHQLVGFALGLLLVFRTNASYDRFWEGRKLWGGMVNECRNLVRLALVHFEGDRDRDLLLRLTRLTALFPYSAMHQLRGTQARYEKAESDHEDFDRLLKAQHAPLAVATEMTTVLRRAHERGAFGEMVLNSLDQNVQLLMGYVGGCERIRKTPLPFAYVVHLRRALFVYCFTLPFALVNTFWWGTVLDVLVVSYVFFGIEEIGVEIEGPFGTDDNDLPLEDICVTIEHNVLSLVGLEAGEREVLAREG